MYLEVDDVLLGPDKALATGHLVSGLEPRLTGGPSIIISSSIIMRWRQRSQGSFCTTENHSAACSPLIAASTKP
jgi:hypothetical protein